MPRNFFDAPIPGQSLTKAPKSFKHQNPPKYTKLSEACDYVFDQLTDERKAHQVLAMLKGKMPMEAIARVVIMSGFSEGLWTPDLGMLMAHPIMYMLAGIASRAGIDAKVTTTDRSGLKDLVHLKKISATDATMAQNKQENPPSAPNKPMRGLLSPPGGG